MRGTRVPTPRGSVGFSGELETREYTVGDSDPRPLPPLRASRGTAWGDAPPVSDLESLINAAAARCSSLIHAATLDHDVSSVIWPVVWCPLNVCGGTTRIYLPSVNETNNEEEDAEMPSGMEHELDRDVAIRLLHRRWDRFQHMGVNGAVPSEDERKLAIADSAWVSGGCKFPQEINSVAVKICYMFPATDAKPVRGIYESVAAPPGTPPKAQVRRWLVDSGCKHDLVSERCLRGLRRYVRNSRRPFVLNTVGGPTDVNREIALQVSDIDGAVICHVPDGDTPAVLSM